MSAESEMVHPFDGSRPNPEEAALVPLSGMHPSDEYKPIPEERALVPLASAHRSNKNFDTTNTPALDTAKVFPKDPKLLAEDFIQAFKATSAQVPEEEKIASIYLKAILESSALDKEEVSRVCEYAGVSNAPHVLSEHVDIPKEIGSYKIIRVIGRGAFSVVCLARDETSWIGREVALKFPTRQRIDAEWMLAACRRELFDRRLRHIVHLAHEQKMQNRRLRSNPQFHRHVA